MDTLSAFAKGEASQGNRVRIFDWDKAAAILANGRVQEAEAGLEGDWEWTGGAILRGGEALTSREDTYVYLASTWATPQLLICGETCLPCWRWLDETPRLGGRDPVARVGAGDPAGQLAAGHHRRQRGR